MNVLLSIDHSASSEIAVKEVAARPWPDGTKMCVLNVVEPPHLLVVPSLLHTATNAARALVGNAADQLAAQGLEASTHVIQDNPRTAIAEYAGLWDAELIVVGSHGQSALTRFLIGSVAQSVLRTAPCSVEVVRTTIHDKPLRERAMKILLATDGSEYSLAAAHSIARRPWPDGSTVRILSVAEVITPAIEPWYVDARILESLREEATTRAHEAVMAAERIVTGAGLETVASVPTGIAKGVIVDEAERWGANLAVVGSHGLRGLKRLLIGSVAEAVAMHAACSVEVIRERASGKH